MDCGFLTESSSINQLASCNTITLDSCLAQAIVNTVHTLIIYVGGTFGMVASENGMTTKKGHLEACILGNKWLNYRLQEDPHYSLQEDPHYMSSTGKKISYDFLETEKLQDSTEMLPYNFQIILSIIEANYYKYDSFIVIHGTDTMCYSGCVISNMITNLTKPIIFTGSMIPINYPNSDAEENLAGALEELGISQESGVFLYFKGKKMPIEECYKYSSFSEDAFRRIPETEKEPELKQHSRVVQNSKDHAKVIFNSEINPYVGCLKVVPFGSSVQLEHYFSQSSGLVIEGYGAGNVPKRYLELIKKYKNVPIVLVTQCVESKVSGEYKVGADVQMCPNVISGGTLTTENALARLAIAIARYNNNDIDIDAIRNFIDNGPNGASH